MHTCVGDLTIIGSENGSSPGRRQAIIWTNAGILLFGPSGINFSEILIDFHTFSFEKVVCKKVAILSLPQCDNCSTSIGCQGNMAIAGRIVFEHQQHWWFLYKIVWGQFWSWSANAPGEHRLIPLAYIDGTPRPDRKVDMQQTGLRSLEALMAAMEISCLFHWCYCCAAYTVKSLI